MRTEHINSLPILIVPVALMLGLSVAATVSVADGRDYNGSYTGAHLNKVAFPVGGVGAGMFCLEGTGTISHVSVKNRMDFFNEPCTFAAVCIKGRSNVARVIEGPIPDWKYFGSPMTGRGSKGASYGLPRFREASFLARFPFGTVSLTDDAVPLDVEITGWSPFIPGNSDDSSLPVGALEYRFKNPTDKRIEGVFSFHSRNFMAIDPRREHSISPMKGGFVLRQPDTEDAPHEQGQFAVFVDDKEAVVDHGWFRGAHYDAFTLVWK
ncbi:MAG: GH116 family glycosyl-hydrolase, partial [Planctomycetota bacterium]